MPSPDRIILGIDPGLGTAGYAVISITAKKIKLLDYGVFRTDSDLCLHERLLVVQQDLEKILERYQPTEAWVEDLYVGMNPKNAILVAQARGVIIVTLAAHGLEPRALTPTQIKVMVTGDGHADKRQIQDMLKKHFSLKVLPTPDDAADALAIAYSGSISV